MLGSTSGRWLLGLVWFVAAGFAAQLAHAHGGPCAPIAAKPVNLRAHSGDTWQTTDAGPFQTDAMPVFSAVFNGTPAFTRAFAVQVQVAADAQFRFRVWNSGTMCIPMVAAGQRTDNIPYGGPKLDAASNYFWRMRFLFVWPSGWSDPCAFSTNGNDADPTVVSSDITRTQTWTKAGSPYVISPAGNRVVI